MSHVQYLLQLASAPVGHKKQHTLIQWHAANHTFPDTDHVSPLQHHQRTYTHKQTYPHTHTHSYIYTLFHLMRPYFFVTRPRVFRVSRSPSQPPFPTAPFEPVYLPPPEWHKEATCLGWCAKQSCSPAVLQNVVEHAITESDARSVRATVSDGTEPKPIGRAFGPALARRPPTEPPGTLCVRARVVLYLCTHLCMLGRLPGAVLGEHFALEKNAWARERERSRGTDRTSRNILLNWGKIWDESSTMGSLAVITVKEIMMSTKSSKISLSMAFLNFKSNWFELLFNKRRNRNLLFWSIWQL